MKLKIILPVAIFCLFSLSIFPQISHPELKCISAPAYYPGAGILFTRKIADDLAYLNVKMLRVEFIADGDGSINYPAYDYITDQAAKRGIKILGLIDYSSLSESNPDVWETEDFRNRYVARVTEIAKHFANRNNPIRHWEIWNEEDLDIGTVNYRIEPEEYAMLLRDSYYAVKAEDAGSSVILGGISPKNFEYETNYLDDLYKTATLIQHYQEKGFHPFDIVACHPYPEIFTNPDPGLANVLNNKIKAFMNANGDAHKKVWLTEMGWSTYYTSESRQSRYLKSSYEMMDALIDPAHPELPPYVERYFWFKYDDFGGPDLWGLVTQDHCREKLSYDAYLNLTEAGPTPPDDNLDPGEDAPLWNTTTDQSLPHQVSGDDLIKDMIPQIISGGFHSATNALGNTNFLLSHLTNGVFDAHHLTLVLADYNQPALRLRYTFQEPIDINAVRIFAGHDRDSGNRAFQSNDIYVNGNPAVMDLSSGNYGQRACESQGVSLVSWEAADGEQFTATNVTTLDIAMWCSTSQSSDFRDRWDPLNDPGIDNDGAGPAYMAPIIKEIDVIGAIHAQSRSRSFMLY